MYVLQTISVELHYFVKYMAGTNLVISVHFRPRTDMSSIYLILTLLYDVLIIVPTFFSHSEHQESSLSHILQTIEPGLSGELSKI